MELRKFGNTSLSISRIGLGMAALGRPGYINLGHGKDIHSHHLPSMRTNAMDMLDLAYENGIRYFDVARSYGKAEEFLGSWIKLHPEKKDIVTGSKWGYVYTADWKVHAEK